MGYILGERGTLGNFPGRFIEKLRPEEVVASSLTDFARRVAKYPGFVYQPKNAFQEFLSRRTGWLKDERIPQLQVYVSPTYNGLEFLASPAHGPKKIVYQENRPQPVPSDRLAIDRDIDSYQTFLVRGAKLIAEFSKLLPKAQVSIVHRFGSQDELDKAVANHTDITAWEEPTFRHSFRRC